MQQTHLVQKSIEEVKFNLSNRADTLLLVVFTPTYTPFSRSFADKKTAFVQWANAVFFNDDGESVRNSF